MSSQKFLELRSIEELAAQYVLLTHGEWDPSDGSYANAFHLLKEMLSRFGADRTNVQLQAARDIYKMFAGPEEPKGS